MFPVTRTYMLQYNLYFAFVAHYRPVVQGDSCCEKLRVLTVVKNLERKSKHHMLSYNRSELLLPKSIFMTDCDRASGYKVGWLLTRYPIQTLWSVNSIATDKFEN